jgi:hypothetical protein
VGEDAAPNNEVAGAVELEEEQVARSKSLELSRSARLPEVDLFQAGLAAEKFEPVEVCYANV